MNIAYEIIVIDDGSNDNTPELTQAFVDSDNNVILLKNSTNKGKGFSIKRGVFSARGEYILFTDMDLSVPIDELSKFIPYLNNGYDITIGSRRIKGSQIMISQPLYRRILGSIFYQIVYIFFFNSIRDTNCGFKCYRREVAVDIFAKQRVSGWGFDTELLYIAHKQRYKIKEVPVRWYNNRISKVNIYKAPFVTLFELCKIKINDWVGRYKK
jgi:dolichyl-phosphate beta-glucosyltransferase